MAIVPRVRSPFPRPCLSACSLVSSSFRPVAALHLRRVARPGCSHFHSFFSRRRTIRTGGFVRSPTQSYVIQPTHTYTAHAVDRGVRREDRRILGRRTHKCPGDHRIYGSQAESKEGAAFDPRNAFPAVRRFGNPCGHRPTNTVYFGPFGTRVTGEGEETHRALNSGGRGLRPILACPPCYSIVKGPSGRVKWSTTVLTNI